MRAMPWPAKVDHRVENMGQGIIFLTVSDAIDEQVQGT